MADDPELFEANIEQASRLMLLAASHCAYAIDFAPDGFEVIPLFNLMDSLRKQADQLDPPGDEWPKEGEGAKVYFFHEEAKKRGG